MSGGTLEIDGLHAGYDGAPVVRDLTLSVAPGEVVALLGANGAGKTTTLRAISGIVHPMEGTITVDGVDTASVSASAVARMGVAHVPEGRGIFYGLTVAEHFKLGARGETLDANAAYDYFPALRDLADRRSGLLSGGEQQMLAVGRALMSAPKLLLLDEPSLGLAPKVVEEILEKLGVLNREGLPILLVEQKAPLALRLANRAYVMSVGRIAAEIDPRTVTSHDDLARYYLG